MYFVFQFYGMSISRSLRSRNFENLRVRINIYNKQIKNKKQKTLLMLLQFTNYHLPPAFPAPEYNLSGHFKNMFLHTFEI